MVVTRDTLVEDIVDIDGVFEYCLGQRVSLISCSGTFPQTLGRLLEIKQAENPDAFIAGLNAFLQTSSQYKK